MNLKSEEKAKKRANALRDNLKRRKDKAKSDKTASQSNEKTNPSDKT